MWNWKLEPVSSVPVKMDEKFLTAIIAWDCNSYLAVFLGCQEAGKVSKPEV